MLPCSIERGRNIVNFGEVGGTDDVVATTRGELGNDSPSAVRVKAPTICFIDFRGNCAGTRCLQRRASGLRGLRIAQVSLAGFAVHIELVDFRVERIADLRHVPGEFDGCASGSHLDLLKSLVC